MGVLRPMLIYFSIFIVLLIYYTFLIYIFTSEDDYQESSVYNFGYPA